MGRIREGEETTAMSKKQVSFSEISPSEFFYRNRDLAGFSNPSRSLYSAMRELVENSLDACEMAGILPDIFIRITPLDSDESKQDPKPYVLRVQDNGPGIDPKNLSYAFGRVFYGSKFKLRQARGMFGMGGTMSILYGQITTNRPVKLMSAIGDGKAVQIQMMIDIRKNAPIVMDKQVVPAEGISGTSVEVTMEGDYFRAASKIQEYLRQTAVITPYANLVFIDALGRQFFYERVTKEMPVPPDETLPHPYGIDVEALRRLLQDSEEATLLKFMQQNFHRVGENTARRFLEFSGFDANMNPKSMETLQAVSLVEALHKYDNFLKPDASCLSPIGKDILKKGIEKELKPEFIAISVRPPSAYSGFPFIVEVGIAYGGKVLPQGLSLLRFANRIPLLYDEGSDISFRILDQDIDWRHYKVRTEAPLGVITHVCSTKVPYKTVGKEYLADRPEIERELKNALRDALRQLQTYLSRQGSMAAVQRKIGIYSKYLPLIAQFVTDLSGAKNLPKYQQLLDSDSDGEDKTAEPIDPVGKPPSDEPPADKAPAAKKKTTKPKAKTTAATKKKKDAPPVETIKVEGQKKAQVEKKKVKQDEKQQTTFEDFG
ncbi:MAG: DNA topoisomerase VI subunit B [Thaumarchaeota archaeon RBG_16_49_8]|nr:MAG: DNA topoisomerase VI subunit B [Thaumarchaeota archaeon RBG_16_49_8]